MASTITRALRQPLTWLVIVAMVLLSLLALESAGGKHAPSVIPLSTVANNQSGDNGGGNPTKHCTDGHGKDGDHNKHCIPSGSQG
jgi:hypothetical protein